MPSNRDGGTGWETSVIECRGGLVTNIAPLQQGINAVGTARQLVNFEPSIKGGYRRIEGYSKYDDEKIPLYGEAVVQGSGQSGTSLEIGNLMKAPINGDQISLPAIGTYTISNVSYNTLSKSATLTLTSPMASSPDDKLAVSFVENSEIPITGISVFDEGVVVARGGNIFYGEGTGWTRINVPSYGTTLVAGGSQTGGTLDVDGLTSAPKAGDTFSIAGVEKVYAVTADATLVGDAATLSISPELDSSPADDAAITWLSSDAADSGKTRFTNHQFSSVDTLIGVTGVGKPFKFDGITYTVIDGNSDTTGAEFVIEFKNHIFYGKGSILSFSEPYLDDDFDTGDGAGSIALPYSITALKVFRDKLIIFSTDSIHYLSGSSVTDFVLESISNGIGCVATDTVQEVGGDILFLGPDGLRLLSGTQNIGDFGLAVASRNIQQDMKDLVESNTSFASCVIRAKSQYRLFGYKTSTTAASSRGVIGVQFADQTAEGMAWSKIRGFKAYVADSEYRSDLFRELVVFANTDGYVYEMESENSFDGRAIEATYYTPFIAVNDPAYRKTINKLYTYTDPEGAVDGQVQLRFDFGVSDKIQPPSITFGEGTSSSTAFYGSATYGISSFSSTPKQVFVNQTVGAGFTVSFEYEFENTYPPFSIDAIVFEYLTNDRQ